MKKLLNLLSVLTIAGTAMPNVIALNSYERHKRQAPPSLQELITTVNIGEIEINNQERIIARLREINHPILSRPDFLENIVIENITPNSAIIHARINIQANEYSIPSSIRFTLNFTAQRLTLSTVITNINLGDIYSNIPINIYNELVRLNPQIPTLAPSINYLSVTNVTQNSAIIRNIDTQEFVRVNFNTNNYSIASRLTVTNLGELPDNSQDTIAKKILLLNPNMDINYIRSIFNITNNSAIVRGYLPNYTYIDNNDYAHLITDTVNVSFTLKQVKFVSTTTENEYATIKPIATKEELLTNQKIVDKFNNLSKKEKQQKLNEINQHYQTLSQNDKKVFKDKLIVISTSAIGTGIIAVGTKITVGGSASSAAVSTGEAVELTPLLSEGLTAAETLSVVEGTTAVVTEGAVIGAEAGTAAALAPETLGLSLVIGGLAIAGTAIIWWLNNHENNSQAVKHELHNQYNEIEKYYKFLAHDQLKLDINSNEWNKIKQIYQENSNNYQEFKNKIKLEITNFHKENHSGWGGSITDDDINTLIKIIYNHFQEINNHFSSCGNNQGWKIVTNTIGNYFKIEQE
ncbi:hypothetical protein SKUN_001730 (plasmid) [Spiroplasma kunkelii CR2-3x]|uniref:Transmembrane protein n=1 Tax=Spiroplasma kunkelii CR2-3x TaxID=273035 RepID=A0A0K2JJG4_SPIKU|nr:hypothetical protein [Spiroplasma kunkelii]ALA98582.1 hypothetical protein SKUN_001730 [Spiroplasma kunkelii CR2-3x]